MKRAKYQAKQKKPQKRANRPLLSVLIGLAVLFIAGGAVALWHFGLSSGGLKSAVHQGAAQKTQPTQTPQPSAQAAVGPAAPAPEPALPPHDYQLGPAVNGEVPVISRIPTKEKVVFLTIDDGIVTNPQDATLMKNDQVKATFFLVHRFIASDYSFFADLAQQTGSDIENHSYDHYILTNLTYDQQKTDICQNADIFTQWFGKRPLIFRPSGGAYDDNSRKAAAACGMKAIVLWDGAINNGSVKYQAGHMQAGDIILMHFRATFAEDLHAFAVDAKNAGLQPELLSDWL